MPKVKDRAEHPTPKSEPKAKVPRKEPVLEEPCASVPKAADTVSAPVGTLALTGGSEESEVAQAVSAPSEQPLCIADAVTLDVGVSAFARPLEWSQPVEAPQDVQTYATMRTTVAYVQRELPSALRTLGHPQRDLMEFDPLSIAEKEGGSRRGQGYKEKWNDANSANALKTTTMYEASGNLMWLDTLLCSAGTQQDTLVRAEPGWQTIVEYQEQFFSSDRALLVEAGGVPPAGSAAEPNILIFPGEALTAFVTDSSVKPQEVGLRLVTGHAMVWAWYYGMACALHSSNNDLISALWDCALSTTIRLRLMTCPMAITRLSMTISESYKAHDRGMADTFVLWVQKALTLVDTKQRVQGNQMSAQKFADALNAQAVMFNGSKVTKQIALAAFAIEPLFTEQGRQCFSALQKIGSHFGHDLANSYAKLQMFVRLAKSCQTTDQQKNKKGDSLVHELGYIFSMLWLSLRRGLVGSKWFTLDVVDKKKDGTPGWYHMTEAKRLAVKYVLNLVAVLPLSKESHGQAFVTKISEGFNDGFCFVTHFSCKDPEGKGEDDIADGESSAMAVDGVPRPVDPIDENQLTIFIEGMPKAYSAAAELLFALYVGEHDADIKLVAAEVDVRVAVEQLDAKLGDVGRKIREIMKLGSTSVSVVEAGKEQAPLSLRALARANSGGGSDAAHGQAMQEERDRLWERAKIQRQKWVQLVSLKTVTKDGIAVALSKAKVCHDFKGVMNESHRGFIMSMDLLGESQTEPWKELWTAKGAYVEAALQYMISQTKPFDLSFCFDGRSRLSRHVAEHAISTAGVNIEELWIVYKSSDPKKRTTMGSKNKETVLAVVPGGRGRMQVKERNKVCEFNAAGETSTFDTTFTAVPPTRVSDLRRISIEDKEKLFPSSTQTSACPGHWTRSAGVPVFWNESKSMDFWMNWIRTWDLGVVVDLSPGSGALAAAAMKQSVQYVGVCQSTAHQVWLANAMNKVAVEMVADAKSPLFISDIANSLKTTFADLFDADLAHNDELSVSSSDGEGDCRDGAKTAMAKSVAKKTK